MQISSSTKKLILFGILVLAFFLCLAGYFMRVSRPVISPLTSTIEPTLIKDEPFRTYTAPKMASKSAYTIFLVGDSMTHALGPHGGTFSEFINSLYKQHGKGIIIDNYASGSTNILGLPEAMTKPITYWDSTFKPLLTQDFDLILIESFGYNPLSKYPLEEGLQKQTETLNQVMKTLISTHPNARIVFVATIAPNKENYAKKTNPNTTVEDRILQAEERIAYIKNHIQYAENHNIPVINIYQESLDAQGNGKREYINPDDDIHPSFAGVDFIGHEIADYIYGNSILPK